MKKPSGLVLLFNGSALLIVLASGVAALRSVFVPDEAAPCSARYDHGTQLALRRPGGELLTAADLQARFGGTDWGLLQNARVVEPKGEAHAQAVEVRLTKAAGPTRASADTRTGMGFSWMPRAMAKPQAACLTYSVLLPADFDFAGGGRLPGIMAGSEDSHDAGPGTISRSGWRSNGALEIRMQMPGWSEARPLVDEHREYTIPRGRWVALEHEIVLNTPGQKDGLVRVWADGALQFEKVGLALRDKAEFKVSGVAAEVVSLGADTRSAAAGDRKLWFSAPELRWQ